MGRKKCLYIVERANKESQEITINKQKSATMKKIAHILGMVVMTTTLMMGVSAEAQHSNASVQSNDDKLQQLYGDWQGDCIPMLSIGENCCSTIWCGVPISSTDMLFENDTLHVIFLLTTLKDLTSYMKIDIHAAENSATCHVGTYTVTDPYGYTRSVYRNSGLTCKLNKNER